MDRCRFHRGLYLALFVAQALATSAGAEPMDKSPWAASHDSAGQADGDVPQTGPCYVDAPQDLRATLVEYQAPAAQAPARPTLPQAAPAPSPGEALPPAPNPIQEPDTTEPSAVPESSLLASSVGDVVAPQSSAPFMIGDAFGPGLASLSQPSLGHGSLQVPTAGVVGQSNLAENFSPMPRDRVFMNYSLFGDVPLNANNGHNGPGVNVNRYTPGFEKTFFNRAASLEVRLPFAGTLDNTIQGDGTSSTNSVRFGNVFLAFKALLRQTDTLAISGGMSMTLPTANDIFIISPAAGLNQLVLRNQEVHLQPFLSFLSTPNDRLYIQGLCQVDLAANSNNATAQIVGVPGFASGTFRDQTYIYSSISAGYWIYRNPCARVSGVSPIFEVHYSKSVSYDNALTLGPLGNSLTLGVPGSNFGLLNMTVGTNIQLGPLSSLLLAYAVPVGSGSCKQFDGEFRLLFNRRFGPQNRLTRAQF